MYQKNFSRQDIVNLFRFIDWIMHLPEAEEKLFWEELADFEEERKMPYITSVEKIGYERGMQEGESLMLARMAAGKFGIGQEKVLTVLRPLSSEALIELADLFFGFESFEDLCGWVQNRVGGEREQ